MDTETHKLARKGNRQNQIETLPLGESVAIAYRVDLAFGLSDDEKNKHAARLRGNLDSQVHRARRKHTDRRYTVESICAPCVQSAAMMFFAVATRTQ
jgi:hypothetical protein